VERDNLIKKNSDEAAARLAKQNDDHANQVRATAAAHAAEVAKFE
jgi:hypothetical protein